MTNLLISMRSTNIQNSLAIQRTPPEKPGVFFIINIHQLAKGIPSGKAGGN
jgi:hypothetical protein